RVLAAVADARMKYKDEIDRARRNRTRRNVAIRAKHGEGSLNFSESLGFGRAATERSCLPILLACPRGQPCRRLFSASEKGRRLYLLLHLRPQELLEEFQANRFNIWTLCFRLACC